MLNGLLKAAGQVGRVADTLQSEDPTLPRLEAVQEAFRIVREVHEDVKKI